MLAYESAIKREFPTVEVDTIDPWRQYLGLRYGGFSNAIRCSEVWPKREINGEIFDLPGYGSVATFCDTMEVEGHMVISIIGPPFYNDRVLWMTFVDSDEEVVPMVYMSRKAAIEGLIRFHYDDIAANDIPDFDKSTMRKLLHRDEVLIIGENVEDYVTNVYYMIQQVTFKGCGLKKPQTPNSDSKTLGHGPRPQGFDAHTK